MESKKVKLKISRKKLEEMSKEEVFQYIEDEKEKYKDARKEARKKKRQAEKQENGILDWTVMVPLGLLIGIVIVGLTVFITSYFFDDFTIPELEATTFELPQQVATHEIRNSEEFQAAGLFWSDSNFSAAIGEIDELIQKSDSDSDLASFFYLRKLEAMVLSGQYNTATQYAQLLQSRYGESNHLMAEVYWYRAYAYYEQGRYHDAMNTFIRISDLRGERAEISYRYALHIHDNKI